jgi:periplasmic copper chaperone A
MKRAFAASIAAAALLLASAAGGAGPHIEVAGAWVRATVPGQPATAAYLRVTSDTDLELVGASSPAAKSCEVHETTQDGDVMRMRAIARLRLLAHEPLVFEELHRHLMLLDLARPLRAGEHIELTLTFADAKAARHSIHVELPVRGSN